MKILISLKTGTQEGNTQMKINYKIDEWNWQLAAGENTHQANKYVTTLIKTLIRF